MSTTQPAVRFVEEDGEWLVEGLILPNGGPVRGQDLTGTHFTKSTDYCLEWFPDGGRPGLYAHGFDSTLGTSVVAREIKSWKDDKGVWLRAQIDRAHEYAAEIKQLAEQGLLSLSSGAVDHLVRIASKSGEIQRWPWVEFSFVPNPANPEAVLYQVKSTDAVLHIREAGSEPVAEITEAVKDSDAAWDAATAQDARRMLTVLLGDETGDPEQARLLRAAIGYIDRFISSETDEIGTLEDIADTTDAGYGWLSADRSFKALPLTPQALHDAAKASGASCAGEVAQPEPVLAVRESVTVPAPDLSALVPDLVAAAQAAVKERLGI